VWLLFYSFPAKHVLGSLFARTQFRPGHFAVERCPLPSFPTFFRTLLQLSALARTSRFPFTAESRPWLWLLQLSGEDGFWSLQFPILR